MNCSHNYLIEGVEHLQPRRRGNDNAAVQRGRKHGSQISTSHTAGVAECSPNCDTKLFSQVALVSRACVASSAKTPPPVPALLDWNTSPTETAAAPEM
jgi:hypothetical protein